VQAETGHTGQSRPARVRRIAECRMGAPQGHSLLAPNIKGLTLLTQTLKLVAELDSYYLVLRYPDVGDVVPYENVDMEDAEDGISKAEQIVESVKNKLNEGD